MKSRSTPCNPDSLAGLQSRVALSACAILVVSVVLAVFGPRLALPGIRQDALTWAAGSAVLGVLLQGVVLGLLLRPLGRLQRRVAPLATSPPQDLPAAALDPLTQLLTAEAFHARLTARLAEEYPACASLLVIDLDRFKPINDRAGRAAGDALLCQVAVVLRSHLRGADDVARLEGDTFAMLLSGCDGATARALGERLRQALSALGVDHEGRRLGVGATVGVASIGAATGSTAADWMARAQSAWYEAKYGGRGAVRVAATPAAVALVEPA